MSTSLGFVRSDQFYPGSHTRQQTQQTHTQSFEIQMERQSVPIDWVRRTAKISVVAQLVFGIFSLVGFVKPVDSKDSILTVLLIFDLVVQFVELVFYVIFVFYKQLDIAFRYIDWFITTPTMLLSLIVFT